MALYSMARQVRKLASEFNNLAISFQASPLLKVRVLRIINLISIAYASRPRLRPRLTQGRSTLPWNPRVYGDREFHPVCVTHVCILTSIRSNLCRHQPSSHMERSSTTLTSVKVQSFGTLFHRQSFSAQDHSMSKLLRIF